MSNVNIRPVEERDIPACSKIVFDAFGSIARKHNFPLDFPDPSMADALFHAFAGNPRVWGVVAEVDGRVVGSNFLDERNAVRGVGPITVDPAVHGRGVGRRLMQAVIDRGQGAQAVRLVQDAFNTTSMSLYASLGFEAKEPLALMRGTPRTKPAAGGTIRPMAEQDLGPCAALCERTHGFARTGELRDAMQHFGPVVLERGGRVVAYASSPRFWALNHGVAETDADLRELLLGIGQVAGGVDLLVPIRSAALFRWLLSEGVRVVKPMTLMTTGAYRDPAPNVWYPSVEY
jgi:predicted N-acetyltransferase YhbS